MVRLTVPDSVPTFEDGLLFDIYLYVNWKTITKKLTTKEKERWADAIDKVKKMIAEAEGYDWTPVDRWWRE